MYQSFFRQWIVLGFLLTMVGSGGLQNDVLAHERSLELYGCLLQGQGPAMPAHVLLEVRPMNGGRNDSHAIDVPLVIKVGGEARHQGGGGVTPSNPRDVVISGGINSHPILRPNRNPLLKEGGASSTHDQAKQQWADEHERKRQEQEGKISDQERRLLLQQLRRDMLKRDRDHASKNLPRPRQ